MLMQSMTVEEKVPTVSDLMDSPLDKYINLAANDRGYGDTAE